MAFGNPMNASARPPSPMGGMGAASAGMPKPTMGVSPDSSGYPDASQIPQLQDAPTQPPAGMEGAKNPILAHLEGIGLIASTLQKNNDPRAEGIKSGLMQIIQTLSGGAGDLPPTMPAGTPGGEAGWYLTHLNLNLKLVLVLVVLQCREWML